MLSRSDKETIVEGLKSNIEKAKAVFLTNLIGVEANEAVQIRKDVRQANGSIVVTRNTLFARAAAGTDCEKLLSELKGPHAVAFAFEDAVGVAKSLKEASKEHEIVKLKGGVLEGKELTLPEIMALADLPSLDQMLGTLLATFNAPISALARVLFAIQEKKEAGEEASAEEKTEEAPVETEA